MNKFIKSNYLYTALFCEENIWHLTQSLIKQGIKSNDIKVVFITNKDKQIAVFNQYAAAENQAVIWDYHVILIVIIAHIPCIFDFDTRLPFVSSYVDYLNNSFADNIDLKYSCLFRIIPAEVYLKHFYSDRSHMKGVISDNDFPKYPAILSNLPTKIELKNLFDYESEIKDTSIIKNTKQLKIWIKQEF
jgi:protein N-terminal glutamine amidohydrolase